MNYQLFSPIGGTDPISNNRDGALLHICRKYHPQYVRMYLSGEMLAHQQQDDRYRKSLGYLMQADCFTMEVQAEERPGLKDVHLFDTFYREFEAILREMHREHPRHVLLVNLSSGTPAMKSALEFLANMLNFKVVPVQVASPKREHNGQREDIIHYDPEAHWAANKDCDPNEYRDRCTALQSPNLMAQLQRKALLEHVNAFDYQAALSTGEQIGELLPERARLLLDAANKRMQLRWAELAPELQEELLTPGLDRQAQELTEYLLAMQAHQQRGDLADFVRSLTPALYHLTLYAVEHTAHFDVQSCCASYVPYKLLRSRLEASTTGLSILQMLDASYFQGYRESPLSSELCIRILDHLVQDDELLDLLHQLRDIEQDVRNPIAHSILPVSEEWIRTTCRHSTKDIMALLRKAAGALLGLDNPWNSYSSMNRMIRESLSVLGE